MAQRHEIEAWVNPAAWGDERRAHEVIDAIEASGSDDEADWVRIAGGDSRDKLSAAARDYARATRQADAARDRLRDIARATYAEGGTTKAAIAESAMVSRPTLNKWLS